MTNKGVCLEKMQTNESALEKMQAKESTPWQEIAIGVSVLVGCERKRSAKRRYESHCV
jgi:hypothetical protein